MRSQKECEITLNSCKTSRDFWLSELSNLDNDVPSYDERRVSYESQLDIWEGKIFALEYVLEIKNTI